MPNFLCAFNAGTERELSECAMKPQLSTMTLNQRVLGSSPSAPTNNPFSLLGFFVWAWRAGRRFGTFCSAPVHLAAEPPGNVHCRSFATAAYLAVMHDAIPRSHAATRTAQFPLPFEARRSDACRGRITATWVCKAHIPSYEPAHPKQDGNSDARAARYVAMSGL
jgi:hypothetical protein